MSEMRRLAQLLVARRPVSFRSSRSQDDSIARLRSQIDADAKGRALRGEADGQGACLAWAGARNSGASVRFEGRWMSKDGSVWLEGVFLPVGRTTIVLQATSLVLLGLLAACAWVFLATDTDSTTKVMLPITTALASIAFPFLAVALGSQREAEEAQIARTLRQVFGTEGDEPARQPRQRWADEED